MPITIFDIVIYLIVGLSAFFGFYKGLMKMVIGFALFLISLAITAMLFPFSKMLVKEYISNIALVNIISAISGYFIALIICFFLKKKLYLLVQDISGGLIDRLSGLIIGLARGLIISGIIFILVAVFVTDSYIKSSNAQEVWEKTDPKKYPKWFKQSKTMKAIHYTIDITIGSLPKEFLEASLQKLPVIEWYKNKKLPEIKKQDIFNNDADLPLQDNNKKDDTELEKELKDFFE